MRKKAFEVPEEYCEQYRNNIKGEIIAKNLGVSSETVYRYFRKHNIIRNYENKEWLNKKYNEEELGVGTIAKLANCSNKVIRKNLKKYNLLDENYSIRSKKYSYNLDFFRKIDTPEKAYWLGFIYADGGLDNKHWRLSFKLQRDDEKHLEKFKNCICSNLSIKHKENYDKRTNKTYFRSELTINNMEIIKQCIELGMTPNSKKTYKVPKLSDDLISHFIRGYFDGDGCFHVNKKQPSITIANCSFDVLEFIVKQLENVIHKKLEIKKEKNKNMYTITIGGSININAIMVFLYQDANKNIMLERKYYKWVNFYNTVFDKRYSLIFAEMQRIREKSPNLLNL